MVPLPRSPKLKPWLTIDSILQRERDSVALSLSPKLESKWPYLQNNGDKNDEDENGNHD